MVPAAPSVPNFSLPSDCAFRKQLAVYGRRSLVDLVQLKTKWEGFQLSALAAAPQVL